MNADNTYLLYCAKNKLLLPVCDSTFTVTQSSLSKLERDYIGCHVIYRNGSVKIIKTIIQNGLWGSGAFRKFISLLSGVKSISVEFVNAENIALDDLKVILLECLNTNGLFDDDYLVEDQALVDTRKEVESATSFRQTFEALKMPSEQDCSDVL